MRLAGCTRPVAGRSAAFSMTRGAKLAKPAPRSGSMTMTRRSSGWRRRAAACRRRAGRANRAPRRRPTSCRARARAATSSSFAPGAAAHAQLAAQRIGVADRLDAHQSGRAALRRRGRGPCSESSPSSRSPGRARAALATKIGRRRLVAGDDGVAAEHLARVARQAAVDAVGEEADRRQRRHRERHGDDEQAQLAGAKVAHQLAPAEPPRRRRRAARRAHGSAVVARGVVMRTRTYTSRERCVQ